MLKYSSVGRIPECINIHLAKLDGHQVFPSAGCWVVPTITVILTTIPNADTIVLLFIIISSENRHVFTKEEKE
jgi:hypothetical protein